MASRLSAPASINITVTPVNDQPTAASQAQTTPEDVALSILLSGADIDGDALGYAIVAGPAHGVLTGAPPNVTYTPALDYFGPDSFTFTATDGQLVSSAATVSLTVTPVNDAPVATDDAAATAPRTAVIIAVLANDRDVDGNPLVVRRLGPAATAPSSGTRTDRLPTRRGTGLRVLTRSRTRSATGKAGPRPPPSV